MAGQPTVLFTNRSATQEFLFSPSDDGVDHKKALKALATKERVGPTLLDTCFTDMLDRQGLIEAIGTRMTTAGMLCAMAVRIEPAAQRSSDDAPATDLPEDAVRPIAELCRSRGGVWARLSGFCFACVFADHTADDGQALAQRLLAAYPETQRQTIFIGTAAYPTINYTRDQLIDNAEKALEHAGFIGPGAITGFDAVSLNISGDRLYQAGDIAGAIDEFKQGLQLDPEDVNLHNSLGVCYGVLKAYNKALACFENAIRLDPDGLMAIYNKGYVLLSQGRREAALQIFLDADTREPNVFEVVFHIGQVYMEMGAVEKARPYLEAATHTNNRSGAAYRILGTCLDALGLTKEAIQAYTSTVKINPEDAESLSILGQLYTQRGESLDVAAALCAQSVRLAPDNGLFRHRLGSVYQTQGRLDDALAEFDLAVSLGHDSRSQIEAIQNRMSAATTSLCKGMD